MKKLSTALAPAAASEAAAASEVVAAAAPVVTQAVSAAANAAKDVVVRANPYGFLPLLPLAVPFVVGAAAKFLGPDEPTKKPNALVSLFSAPTLIGAGTGYAVGAAMKADDKTRLAYAAVGLGTGWIVQHYIIVPREMEAEAAAAAAAEAEASKTVWYKPWTWF